MIVETRRISPEGRGMWQARCECGWAGGLYGPDALTRRAGALHTPDEAGHAAEHS